MDSYPDIPCEPTSLFLELASLPPKPPRSKLEPHRELIRELRRKGRTYREVARLFEERVGFHVAPSTLHSFVKVRARHRKQVQFELPPADVMRESAPPSISRVAAFKAKHTVQEEAVALRLPRKRTSHSQPSGRCSMTNSKRVVFTMGGKGGVGKTGVMVALAEWFEANEISVTLLDLDTENKARGSLKHFFSGTVTKVNIHTPAGLDAFVDHLDGGSEIILADMGAGAGQVAADWFESMYEDVAATGVSFTAVGVVTPDPASVESILAWANRLQDRVEYVVIENATSTLSDFTYWRSTEQAKKFRDAFSPTVLQMEFRLAELENPVRQHGIKLGDVADRKATVEELKRASLVMRAQSYRRRLFSEFDRTKEVFLP